MNTVNVVLYILVLILISQSFIIFYLLQSFKNIIKEVKERAQNSELSLDPQVYTNTTRSEILSIFSFKNKELIFISPHCSTCQVLFDGLSKVQTSFIFVLMEKNLEWERGNIIVSPDLFEQLNIKTTPIQVNFNENKEVTLKKILYAQTDVSSA